jgi:hypothetical protein
MGAHRATGGVTALETRVAALEAQNIALQATVSQLLSDLAAIGPHVAAYTNADAIAAVDPTGVLDLLWRGFGSDINEVYLEGANLHVNNGLGDTATTNSLGNIIIGYNELRPLEHSIVDDRSGSHMLVVGRFNNYSSFGGVINGYLNSTSGRWSSSAGYGNNASGYFSSINGGAGNTASGTFSYASGGLKNTASGVYSTVNGGELNDASGFKSVLP